MSQPLNNCISVGRFKSGDTFIVMFIEFTVHIAANTCSSTYSFNTAVAELMKLSNTLKLYYESATQHSPSSIGQYAAFSFVVICIESSQLWPPPYTSMFYIIHWLVIKNLGGGLLSSYKYEHDEPRLLLKIGARSHRRYYMCRDNLQIGYSPYVSVLSRYCTVSLPKIILRY